MNWSRLGGCVNVSEEKQGKPLNMKITDRTKVKALYLC